MPQTAVRTQVVEFLNSHRKAVFAVVDAEGRPHTSLMLYSVDDEFNVYFGTRKAFRKYDQVMANNHVSLSVIEEVLDPLQAVDIRGVAEPLSPEEQATWFAHFKAKNPSKYYVEGADDYVMFRVRPTMIRWLDAVTGELTITELG
jgi:general stress protein 26